MHDETRDHSRPYPLPANEAERLAELRCYDILDTPQEEDFDHLVLLASKLLRAPVALISLIEDERQWFKAKVGIDVCETSRDVSFCAHAIVEKAPVMVVPDARLDPRFATNPLVVSPPHVRFYAGAPLVSPSGQQIGTLCCIDVEPRPDGISCEEKHLLAALAQAVIDRMELRRTTVAHRASQARFERITATSPDAVVCADAEGRITSWNIAAETMFGHKAADVLGCSLTALMPEAKRRGHDAGLARAAAGGVPHLVGKTLELEALRANGEAFPIELSLSAWQEDGAKAFGAIIRDVTGRKRAEAHLHYLAHHDTLTGLANREYLRRSLRRTVEEAARQARPAAMMLVGLDHFKDVNDALGHAAGDAVLVEMAGRLRRSVRERDLVARIGGDEFAVLLDGLDNVDTAATVAAELIVALGEPCALEGQRVHAGASVGIVMCPCDGNTVDALMVNADLALHRAKKEGRGRYQFFDPNLRVEVEARRVLEGELRRAVAEEEFVLHYQPQVDMTDGRVVGVEALLRWNHPERGLLPPGAFLSVLEESSLAARAGTWVLRTACRQARAWLDAGLPPLRMGVNLSPAQFCTGDLAAHVERTLVETGLPPERLELEITENIVLKRETTIIEPLRRLRRLGVSIAFDDFGTGYASLSHLRHFPIDRIKIDRSFIGDIGKTGDGGAITRSVIGLGKSLGLKVIAEGIEELDQEGFLRLHKCDEAQGYMYGRPMPPQEIEAILRNQQNLAALKTNA